MLNDINTSSYHTPIMLPQVLSLLRPERGGTYVDGTLGGAVTASNFAFTPCRRQIVRH